MTFLHNKKEIFIGSGILVILATFSILIPQFHFYAGVMVGFFLTGLFSPCLKRKLIRVYEKGKSNNQNAVIFWILFSITISFFLILGAYRFGEVNLGDFTTLGSFVTGLIMFPIGGILWMLYVIPKSDGALQDDEE